MREHTIAQLYTGLQEKNADMMARCYQPDATFTDPVFRDLQGEQVWQMWAMLIERASDMRVVFRDITIEGNTGTAQWEAWYPFSATGRRVHNRVSSRFWFRDDKIAKQVDSFDFWAWSRQALGLPGILLGWSPLLKKKVRENAAKSLASYSARHRDQPS